MPARIIFSDLDGTLINDQGIVTPETKAVIRKQIVAGNVFVPVSGRMPKAAMHVVNQVTKVCPVISYNGALILDEVGNVLVSKFFTAAEAIKLCKRAEELTTKTSWSVFSGNDWYLQDGPADTDIINFTIKALAVQPGKAVYEKIAQLKGAHKVMLIGAPDELDRVQPLLQKEFSDLYMVKSGPTYLEIMVKGVSKREGVKEMAKQMHVELADCYAFGDNFNDEEMLQEVGHPFLMGNAPKQLQHQFTSITRDNNHDGIAAVLKQL